MTPAALRVPLRVPMLLIVGVAAAALFRWAYPGAFDDALVPLGFLLTIALGVAFITPLRTAASRVIDWLKNPPPARRRITALFIGAAAFGYLLANAIIHGRDLTPRLQDEFSYLLQAQLLAHGR